MAIPSLVHCTLAEAGYRLMQQQRLGLKSCTGEPDLEQACDWLFVHRQFEHHPLPGITLASTIASTALTHDAPLRFSKPWYGLTC